MKEIVRAGLVLFIITAIAAVSLGYIQNITAEPIARQAEKEENEALKLLISDADRFDKDEIAPPDGIEGIITAYDASGAQVGYAIRLASNGYGGAITMMVGFDMEGSVKGIEILEHSETPGLGANAATQWFKGQYVGKSDFPLKVTSAGGDDAIDAITSATITSNAVTDGVNAAHEWLVNYQAQGGNGQ